jgi:hypothetical protein
MNEIQMIRDVSVNDYIDEINDAINTHNYLSALTLTLLIPDICSKSIKNCGYVRWFNKYVYRNYFDFPKNKDINYKKSKTYKIKFNGSTCYALRNAIIHSGNPNISFKKKNDRIKANVDNIELCVNGKSDKDNQYGEAITFFYFNDNIKTVTIRINIVLFAEKMINGYKDFLKDNNIDNIYLFQMIDWDKK